MFFHTQQWEGGSSSKENKLLCFVKYFHGGVEALCLVLLHLMEYQLHHVFWLLGPFMCLIWWSYGFEKSTRICTLFSPTPLITHLENVPYVSLSSGNTPLAKKVSYGLEFYSLKSSGESWDRPCGHHQRVGQLRWQRFYRPECQAACSIIGVN